MGFNFQRFRANVKYLCEKHKVKQCALEKIIGVGAGYLSREGKNAPGIDKIIAIAEYFKVSMDSLLNEELSMKEKNNLSLAQSFIETLKNMTDLGTIIWNVEEYMWNSYDAGYPLFRYLEKGTDYNNVEELYEDDEEYDLVGMAYRYEGWGKFENLLYVGTLENGDYFMLIKVSKESKSGWVLYRVVYELHQYYDDEVGSYEKLERNCSMLFNTIDGAKELLNDAINRLVDSIVQSIDDLYLDWSTKAYLRDFINEE